MSRQVTKKISTTKKTATKKTATKKTAAKKTAAKKVSPKNEYVKGKIQKKYFTNTIDNTQMSIDHVLTFAPKNYVPNKFFVDKKMTYPKTVKVVQKINELYLIQVDKLGSFVFDEELLRFGLLHAQNKFNPMDYFISLVLYKTYDKKQVQKKLDVSFQDKSPESKSKAIKDLKKAGLL
jgi:NAD-specific glutamate dehydrogenase